ncbi:MAG TPA: D-alanyl-D-alanine carboxypeptidase family protein [Candidatus Atribacteria bacterium]|nr:D-alanyl-D-alanine carboxypeptidase family protein [Candidatus Atribacteria bacterium]
MKSIGKLLVSIIILSIVFLSSGPVYAETTEFESIAPAAILIEASTGRVLYEKNADEPRTPASITKIMTLLLAFEALEQGTVGWDDPVTISENAWAYKVGGSVMFLEVGTQVPFGVIVTGTAVVSGNDGCVAIAEHLYGTEQAFVQQMNKKAQELGLTNTQFKNSNGLEAEGHYMSPRDIATLARYFINKYPKILEIESMTEFTYDGITQYNRNPLLGVYPGADGLKTGWTDEAGYCLVGTAKQDGMRLISVVMNTKNEAERLAASTELLNYGFRNYELHKAIEANKPFREVDIKKGKKLTVPVQVAKDLYAVVPKNSQNDISLDIKLDNDPITAPIAAGTRVGIVEVKLADEVLASAEISTAEEVKKAGFFELLFRSIIEFFKSLFKIS